MARSVQSVVINTCRLVDGTLLLQHMHNLRSDSVGRLVATQASEPHFAGKARRGEGRFCLSICLSLRLSVKPFGYGWTLRV